LSTFLFDNIVFGPVQSRRLGASLGVNLMPSDCKRCNFDCIYCECGRNTDELESKKLPSRQKIYTALESKLISLHQNGILPDSITFAGNGEPTIHPAFSGIIEDTVWLRDQYALYSKISVLTNATMLHRNDIVNALKKTDMPILKFDSAIDETIELLNQPAKKVVVSQLIEQIKLLGEKCFVQTMFLQGTYREQTVDNTTPEELDAWEQAILAIRPQQVMIYTIDRNTPVDTLYKISGDKLREISGRIEKHGIATTVSE